MNHQKTWHGGVHTCFIPQWSCYCNLVLWAVMVAIQSTLQWHLWAEMFIPSPNAPNPVGHSVNKDIHTHYTLPGIFNPSSVDALVDVHGRSHSFPLIHPREVFLAWHWVMAIPSSSCGVVLLSLHLRIGMTEVGLVHLTHTWQTPKYKGMPASDATRMSWLQCRMHECPCWPFTSYKGTSVMIWCTTSWGLCSHLSLIFLFLWKASTLTRMKLPDFKPMVPIFWSYYHFLSSCLCCRLGLGLLKGDTQLVSDSGYIFIHILAGGASLWDLCAP